MPRLSSTLGILPLSIGLLVACGSPRRSYHHEATVGQSHEIVQQSQSEHTAQSGEQRTTTHEYIEIEEEIPADSLPRPRRRLMRLWRERSTRVVDSVTHTSTTRGQRLESKRRLQVEQRQEMSRRSHRGKGYLIGIVLVTLGVLAFVIYKRIRPLVRLWRWIG